MSYYKSQLEKLNIIHPDSDPKIVISDGLGNTSKSLNLNEESIVELDKWLREMLFMLRQKELTE